MPNSVDARPAPTRAEEAANTAVQALGAVLGLAGLVYLIHRAIPHGAATVAGVALYGATLVLSFTASALYHAVPPGDAKARLRTLDHCAIYLLIAGTYTPIVLAVLQGHDRWVLLSLVWGVALLGVVLRLVGRRRLLKLRILLYLVLGWLVVGWSGQVSAGLGPTGTALLVAGGLTYTAGVGFYLWRRLPFNGAVWHAFVVAGSLCFFFAIAGYALPA